MTDGLSGIGPTRGGKGRWGKKCNGLTRTCDGMCGPIRPTVLVISPLCQGAMQGGTVGTRLDAESETFWE